MSEENIEVVRRFFWGFECDGEAMLETLDPQVEWSPFEEHHSPSHGHDGATRIREQWLNTWEDHRIEVTEVIDGGDDIVVCAHINARGKGSGVEVDVDLYGHFRLREGRIVYLYEHEDKGEALEAARLSE